MSDHIVCNSPNTQYGGEDWCARIIGSFNRCSEAVSGKDGSVRCLYMPSEVVGFIIGQSLAMRREIDELRSKVRRLEASQSETEDED